MSSKSPYCSLFVTFKLLVSFQFRIHNYNAENNIGKLGEHVTTQKTVCLLNDSFPPQIDGVSNTVLNYARHTEENGFAPLVVTPSHPQAEDQKYPFPIARYPSINFSKMDGYMAGIPFSPEVAGKTSKNNVTLLHSHCPIMSTFMARELRQIVDAPIILTYHTKFDVDIENIIKNKPLQIASKKAIVANINACDEVWAVSRGAGENLRSLGYKGDYIVMPNGVDLPKERVSVEEIAQATKGYDLPYDIPMYLYVGRMMWYKGIKITLDGLSKLKKQGKDFRMVFIGDGDDLDEIKAYSTNIGIEDNCVFTGAIRQRDVLRAWYCRANLFLFPSSYDTNGLVVREAAACSLGAVLIKNSCASEGVTDGRNGFLIDENSDSLCKCLLALHDNKDKMQTVGITAGCELYLSWGDSVKAATRRYETVIERYKRGYYPKHYKPMEGFMKINGELMESLAALSNKRKSK